MVFCDPLTIDRMYDMFFGHTKFNKFFIQDCLSAACRFNAKIQNIDHTIAKFQIDVGQCIDQSGQTLLHIACSHGRDLSIVSYLIKKYPRLITIIDREGNSCLSTACWYNTNPEIADFLIKKIKMDPTHKVFNSSDCVSLTRKNVAMAAYFIEETQLNCFSLCYYLTETLISNLLMATKKIIQES